MYIDLVTDKVRLQRYRELFGFYFCGDTSNVCEQRRGSGNTWRRRFESRGYGDASDV